MRRILFATLLPALLLAAPLEIVRPIVSLTDGGPGEPPGFEHSPGDILYFTCRVSGFSQTEDRKLRVSYSVQAVDPKGVPLHEPYKNEIAVEVTVQDKEWTPKIATSFSIPPIAPSGDYKILVKADDLVAKTSTELAVPFRVRSRDVEPSETLVVRNFHFYRAEDDTQPLAKPAYKPGDAVWAKFDLTGFQYGPKNKIDVSYLISVIAPSGKVLWTQPEPAGEKSESFYPKSYVSASMSITLQNNMRPGDYTIALQAKDAIGGQTHDQKYTFTVE